MNKLCKYIVALMFVLVFTAGCSRQAAPPDTVIIEQIPPLNSESTEQTTQLNPVSAEEAPYHIGIITLGSANADDDYRGARALVTEFGAAEDGGMVRHIVPPENFRGEQETFMAMITGLAEDSLMKAIIVFHSIEGTAAAFQKIKDSGREDMLLIAAQPQDAPEIISQAADIIVDYYDNVARGYYDIVRAKNMGAKHFVFLSFPRHMSNEGLYRKKNIYEETCKDLDIEFVFVTVPDPVEIGVPNVQKQVYDMMPSLVDKYGKDTAFFTTNWPLTETIIQGVIELGALFVITDDAVPFLGFPEALGLDSSNLGYDYPAIVAKIEEAVVTKGGGGRLGCFAYSPPYCHSAGLGHLAMDMIEGKSTDIQKDIVTIYQALTPGCDWMSDIFRYPDGRTINNYYFLSMDTYIFGQGYSGVFSEPFPEKYYSIE